MAPPPGHWIDGRARGEQRLPDRVGEYVVEIEVQLRHGTDARPAGAIDRDDRLKADLEIAADPDHPRIDRAGSDEWIAEIVGHGRRELGLHDRDQMVDEIGQAEVDDVRLQVGHAELHRRSPYQILRNATGRDQIERGCRDLVADLSGYRDRPQES